MDAIRDLFTQLLQLDEYLGQIIRAYGVWTNAILFAIVFCETGLVVTPFLPGDSLLFAAGAFAAKGSLNLWAVIGLLTLAGILGDALNYAVGYYLGPRLNGSGRGRFIKARHLERTRQFYRKYGKVTIILARFVPIVRTFAPFLAGVGSMNYLEFAVYNVVGAALWVVSFVMGGYFFGNLPVIKENFALVILAIIVLSVLPVAVELLRRREGAKSA